MVTQRVHSSLPASPLHSTPAEMKAGKDERPGNLLCLVYIS
jgi:hypothetical protein